MFSDILLPILLSVSMIQPNELMYSNGVTHNSFMNVYFEKLDTYFGNNVRINGSIPSGLCGYVAMGMYLSYLDTYRNDNVVDDDYIQSVSCNSLNDIKYRTGNATAPGNKNVNYQLGFTNYNINTWEDWFNNYYALYNDGTDLLVRLTGIGHDIGLYEQGLGLFQQNNPQFFSLKDGDIGDILDEYFYQEATSLNYTLSSLYRSDSLSSKISFITNSLDNNIPVIVCTENDIYDSFLQCSGGHVMIVYDYSTNQSTGITTFYCHTGWHDNNRLMSFTTDYANNGYSYNGLPSYIVEVYKVTVSGHVHSSNIYLNNTGLCPCQFDPYHGSHTHVYNYSYTDYGHNVFHKAFCMCNAYVSLMHEYDNNDRCIDCGHRG